MPRRNSFTITAGADMHAHFRQGAVMRLVTPATAREFGMAIAMPNTNPPITSMEQSRQYTFELEQAAQNPAFTPLGVVYLTDTLSPKEVRLGYEEGVWVAAKLYPLGGTTGSDSAASSVDAIRDVLEVMQEIGMKLLVHGEVVTKDGDDLSRWDRERVYISDVLVRILAEFPQLKVVFEHISTKEAVDFVRSDTSRRLAATITPHHLLYTDADVSKKGVHTHANCMPIIKGPEDRRALRAAATSGDPRFFAGTDTAPHEVGTKHSSCCSFGAFVAPGAVAAYAAVFEQEGVFEEEDGVERFERFLSLSGPAFYGIPPAKGKLTLVRDEYKVRERFLIPGMAIGSPNQEIVPVFHEDLGLAPVFPWSIRSRN